MQMPALLKIGGVLLSEVPWRLQWEGACPMEAGRHKHKFPPELSAGVLHSCHTDGSWCE